MPTIGIIGGMGPQASARLLSQIIEKAPNHMPIKDDSDFPEIILLSVPVPNFVNSKTNIVHAQNILLRKLPLLELANCDIAGIACNTAHQFLSVIQAATTIQFVSIPHEAAKIIDKHHFSKAGLLGSPSTLSSSLFDDALSLGVTLVRPAKNNIRTIEKLIRKQIAGKITLSDRDFFRKIVDNFISDHKLDIVILGCTELPLILGAHPLAIDTIDILADALLHKSTHKNT